MHPPTPVSLLSRLRKPDDTAAWERFVHLYTPMLHAWACRTGLQSSDAADLVQDVFLTLVREMPNFRYDPSRSFHQWLKSVTMNRWRDWMRRPVQHPIGHDGDQIESSEPDGVDTFIEREFGAEFARRALELMRTDFDESTWRACWEMAVKGRTAAEVAPELGITVGAAHAARFRVIARLRKELAGMWE